MDVALDNIIFALQTHGGISVYWAELLRRASKDGAKWLDPAHALLNLSRASLHDIAIRGKNTIFPSQVDRYRPVDSNATIVHSSYYRIPKLTKTRLITTVYDFTYEKYRHGPALWLHHAQKMAAIKRSEVVLCISNSTAMDLIKFCGKDYSRKIEVTHLAVSPNFRRIPNAKDALVTKHSWLAETLQSKRLLLFVGSRINYKRFDLAVKSCANYADSHLVAIGGGAIMPTEKKFIQECDLENRISFIPLASSEELAQWYSISHALLYLSDYEGFGLPVLEASQCGCPVLAQINSSIPEVHGFHDILVTSPDPKGNLNEILKSLENEKIRGKAISSMSAHADTFTWDKCWELTSNIYRSI